MSFSLAVEGDVDSYWAVAISEAAWLVYKDKVTPADIDAGMKLGTRWSSGPCEYANRVGIDLMFDKLKAPHDKYKMGIRYPVTGDVKFDNVKVHRLAYSWSA